jgi:hypothetical protein
MVIGVDRFRAHFAGHEHQYVLIGGAACELIMDEVGLDFRATKDLDIVLVVEALDSAFAERFWAFVEEGGYEVRERSEGAKVLYRFQKPKGRGFSRHARAVLARARGTEACSGCPPDAAPDRRGSRQLVGNPA